MLPKELYNKLAEEIAQAERPREKAVNVMYSVQNHYGYLTDEGVREVAALLAMTPLEVEELATFYDFIYRQKVGTYVIHVCDGVVCWMQHENSVFNYLVKKLGIQAGETTPDGLFTILPSACIGDCHNAPAMLINGQFYGRLTPQKIDEVLERLKNERCDSVICR